MTVAAATGGEESLHARMHAAIWGAELAALTSHEHPAQPWALHADLARLAWDGMRHAAVLDRALTAEGRPWGSEPVDLGAVRRGLRAGPPRPPGRAGPSQAEAHAAASSAEDFRPRRPAHLQADAAFHAALLARAVELSVSG